MPEILEDRHFECIFFIEETKVVISFAGFPPNLAIMGNALSMILTNMARDRY